MGIEKWAVKCGWAIFMDLFLCWLIDVRHIRNRNENCVEVSLISTGFVKINKPESQVLLQMWS